MKCLFFLEITFFFEFSTEKLLPLRAKFLETILNFARQNNYSYFLGKLVVQ